jgi:hypothetical protein
MLELSVERHCGTRAEVVGCGLFVRVGKAGQEAALVHGTAPVLLRLQVDSDSTYAPTE